MHILIVRQITARRTSEDNNSFSRWHLNVLIFESLFLSTRRDATRWTWTFLHRKTYSLLFVHSTYSFLFGQSSFCLSFYNFIRFIYLLIFFFFGIFYLFFVELWLFVIFVVFHFVFISLCCTSTAMNISV